jgi:hypothetical protein
MTLASSSTFILKKTLLEDNQDMEGEREKFLP